MKDPECMRDKLHALAIEADEMLGSCDASDILDTLEEARNVMTEGAEVIARLMVELEQAERERDAAVADVKNLCATNYFSGDFCAYCKYKEPDGQCFHDCTPYSDNWGWEWRGVQDSKTLVCPVNGAPCNECKPGSPCAEVANDG